MKLWILRPRKDLLEQDNLWKPWYDKVLGFVVRAETEEQARGYADKKAEGENDDGDRPWLDPNMSTCNELTPEGEEGVVMRDFARG